MLTENQWSIRHVLPVHNIVGEGLLWCQEEESLYWVDIPAKTIFRYCPSRNHFYRFHFDYQISSIAQRTRGGFVLATDQGFVFWDEKGDGSNEIVKLVGDEEGWRLNDGAVDSRGRFWSGTIYPKTSNKKGCLYRLDPDLSIHMMETGVWGSNGLAWSPDGQFLYFTDTRRRIIYKYDYSSSSGKIVNRRVLVQVPERHGEGVPDGLTVDNDGFLWSIRWGGWKICRYSPDGELEREVSLPIKYPTSCVFGGEYFHVLFITSAASPYGCVENTPPYAGDLFSLQGDIHGFEGKKFGG